MNKLNVGFIGLGRMGLPMSHLLAKDHNLVAYDSQQSHSSTVNSVESLQALMEALPAPRVVWLMIPAAAVPDLVTEILPMLNKGDIVIDGGNSAFADSLEVISSLTDTGIDYVCVGCSGGISGAQQGPPMSISCDAHVLETIQPLLTSLGGNFSWLEQPGFGHLAKGIHNAIEYGMMQSIADGIQLYFDQGFSQQQILQTLQTWSSNSIIESRLLQCAIECLHNEDFSIPLTIKHSETLALLQQLCDNKNLPAINAAISVRAGTENSGDQARTALALMRQHFGGHEVNSSEDPQ